MPDLEPQHLYPRKDTAEHVASADCPCKPARLEGHGGIVTILRHQTMQAPAPEEPTPIAQALAAWMAHADLYLDGERVRQGVNLVGTPKEAAEYAEIIADWIKANGADRTALTDHLLDATGPARRFRAWSFAPAIAEGALRFLRETGLIP